MCVCVCVCPVLTWLDAQLPHGGVAQDLGDLVVDVATQQEGREVVVVRTRADSVHQARTGPVPVLVDIANLSGGQRKQQSTEGRVI